MVSGDVFRVHFSWERPQGCIIPRSHGSVPAAISVLLMSLAYLVGSTLLTPDFGKIQSERVFSMKSFTSPSGTTLMFRLSSSDSILGAEIVFRVAEFNIPSGFRPIMPSRRPRMKEYSKGIVFVSSRQSILIYKSSQSEFICKS